MFCWSVGAVNMVSVEGRSRVRLTYTAVGCVGSSTSPVSAMATALGSGLSLIMMLKFGKVGIEKVEFS